jgi:hypothetical protein
MAAVPGTNRYLGTQYRPTNNNNKLPAPQKEICFMTQSCEGSNPTENAPQNINNLFNKITLILPFGCYAV